MSEVFLGINKTGELYVDATLDASITSPGVLRENLAKIRMFGTVFS